MTKTLRHLEFFSWWLVVICVLTISVYVHWRAGFSFPNPEEDEPWYLWTSVELCDTGHWASPSLRPEAPLVLSPLFAIANAILFKLSGVSLSAARWLSWACMALAFLALLDMVRRRPWPWLSLFVLSLFLLGADSVIAGNMVRPEAMLWMLVAWGFNLLDRDKTGPGLLLVALCMNLHLVGYVFFAGALCVAGIQAFERLRNNRRWTMGEKIWLACAALAAFAIVLYNLCTLDTAIFASSFNEDYSTLWFRLIRHNRWFWLLAGGFAWVYCLLRKRTYVCFLSLALLALLPKVLRAQCWYCVYQSQGYAMLLLALSWVAMDWPLSGGAHTKRFAAVAIAMGMLWLAFHRGWIAGPRNYPENLRWKTPGRLYCDDIVIEKTPPVYLSQEDKEAILAEIAKNLDGRPRPVRVQFCPAADGLFFHGLLPDGVIPYQGVRTKVLGDISVFRRSRHPTGWRKSFVKYRLAQCNGSDLPPFHTRDGTESWIFVDGAPPPWEK